MLAVHIHRHGGPAVLSLDEVPRPALSNSNGVLVAMRTAALNHPDVDTQRSARCILAPAHRYLEESRHHGKVVITFPNK